MARPAAHLKAAAGVSELRADLSLEPYTFGHFTFSVTGLTVSGKPKQAEWEAVGEMLAVQTRGLQLMVGDWLRIGKDLYGDLAYQVIDARSWKDSTIRVYEHVAGKLPLESRKYLDCGLDYSHLQAVAALSPREQLTWLERAATGDAEPWSVVRLKAAVKDGADQAPTAWYVIATCQNEIDQARLQKRLELDGYACKIITKRGST